MTRVGDANDLEMLRRALRVFKNTTDRPTLIIVDSHIAYGAPNKQDTGAAHGEPLGEEEIRLTKRFYGWPEDAKFLVPDGVREHLRDGVGQRGRELREAWEARFEEYGSAASRAGRPSRPDAATAACPTDGTAIFPSSPRIRRASPAATRRARC